MTDLPPESCWQLPAPFVLTFDVQTADIDAYEHVNNTVYLRWIDAAAWAHSDAAGMTTDYCKSIERGFAVHRHEIDYIGSAHLGDRVHVATWITGLDGRLRSQRRFQIIRESDLKTLVNARTVFICTNLKTGKPTRMPPEFKEAYQVDDRVAAALAAEAA
ncbi:acyl-CoA thioesterase [Ruegeria halocynthiae]|uniref:acyl-CoA thioesterase n=1 Tax=Ruegeria halocynthiae TaxID=985054 RepID=UPI00068CA58D|nr:thioesterase family protein [Ruegeria halocynthiae]